MTGDAIREEVPAIVAWLRAYKDCGLAQSYADAIGRGAVAAPDVGSLAAEEPKS